MIETNRQDYKKELEEVVYMFSTGEGLEITHTQTENDGEYLDTVTINGKVYNAKNRHTYTDFLDKKRYEKRFSKLCLYNALSNHFGVTLKWGALTGIRPAKMARDLGENFEREFSSVFGVHDKKIKLVKEILQVQEKIYDKYSNHSGLFIGIPFCPSRCLYCSFISEEIGKSKYIKEYKNALVKEINALPNSAVNVRSVYVGGGTPVCLEDEDFYEILSAVKGKIPPNIEFTVEAGRPDVITEKKLQIMKDAGVTRVCVNPQTFSNDTLKLIGRKHTASDVIEKFKLVKSYGFLVNCDVIAGLSGESFQDFQNTIDTAVSLNADNITVHTLCLKKGAKLKTETERLKVDFIDQMIDYSYTALKGAGYKPYYMYRQKYAAENLENVGYAKPNTECIYNVDVMEENSNNPACGANAVSKRVYASENRIERYGTPKDIKTYIEKIDKIIDEKNKFFG